MNELALFASTFLFVFALCFQQLNVNGMHYGLAFITAFVIGAANLVILRIVPSATIAEILAYLAGGPFGVVAAMWVQPRVVQWRARRREVRSNIPAILKRTSVYSDHAIWKRHG